MTEPNCNVQRPVLPEDEHAVTRRAAAKTIDFLWRCMLIFLANATSTVHNFQP
jgi:hypothetical protein